MTRPAHPQDEHPFRSFLGIHWSARLPASDALVLRGIEPENFEPTQFTISARQMVALLRTLEEAEAAQRGEPRQCHLPSWLAGFESGTLLGAMPPRATSAARTRETPTSPEHQTHRPPLRSEAPSPASSPSSDSSVGSSTVPTMEDGGRVGNDPAASAPVVAVARQAIQQWAPGLSWDALAERLSDEQVMTLFDLLRAGAAA